MGLFRRKRAQPSAEAVIPPAGSSSDPGGARPVASGDVRIEVHDQAGSAARIGADVRHVLSFADFNDAFTFQETVFERVSSVTEVQMTNPQAEQLQSLVSTVGAGMDPSTFGGHVVVVLGPASVGDELKELAVAQAGTYECQA